MGFQWNRYDTWRMSVVCWCSVCDRSKIKGKRMDRFINQSDIANGLWVIVAKHKCINCEIAF